MESMRRCVHAWLTSLVVLVALGLAGCASDGVRPVLHYGVEDAPEGKRILWPAPPEVPRYMYAGQLTGEANFRKSDDMRRGATGFLRWLAGIIVGEKPPVVLQRPHAGTVDEAGRVYVTDMSRQGVFVFDDKRGELSVWDRAEGLANFVAPAGIALASDGRVLVTDAELGIVARLDRDGNPMRSIGRGLFKRPTGIAYDPVKRRIFVADTQAHDVKVLDEQGALVATIGRAGSAAGELNYPTHLTYSHGRLYVTDTMNSRVQVFDSATGELKLNFGERGLYVGNMVRPKGVGVDSEGNIYVIESYFDHMLVYNARGRFLMSVGGVGRGTGRFYLPAGVWVDSRNRVFVADMFNGRVVVFQFLGGDGEGAQ
jgi:DNA-binding beta-propeller fold protein YncE